MHWWRHRARCRRLQQRRPYAAQTADRAAAGKAADNGPLHIPPVVSLLRPLQHSWVWVRLLAMKFRTRPVGDVLGSSELVLGDRAVTISDLRAEGFGFVVFFGDGIDQEQADTIEEAKWIALGRPTGPLPVAPDTI